MKKLCMVISILFITTFAFSQNQDSTQAAADGAVKVFTWDVHTSAKGTIMFLNVPFKRDKHDATEHIKLTVAKGISKQRPEFITVTIPDNIDKANGLFIKFAYSSKQKNGEQKMELDNGKPLKINFENCNGGYCTAIIINGYVTDEETKEKIDIFQKLLDLDDVLFLFIYPDGSHKSVAVPLYSFRQQYKKL